MLVALASMLVLAPQTGGAPSPQGASTRPQVDETFLEVPVRIIHVLDSQGNAEFFGNIHEVMTPRIAKDQLAAINDLYGPCKIRFTLAPEDFETRRDDYLNLDSDPPERWTVEAPQSSKPESVGVSGHYKAFQKVANERPERLTMIVHRGSEWRWNGRKRLWEFSVGFSHGGNWFGPKQGAYVRICGTAPRVWAHELGHSLGLPHTSLDGVHAPSKLLTDDDISAACADYLAKGGDPNHPEYAIDGDIKAGVTDTPPDPGLGFWGSSKELNRLVTIRLSGRAPFQIVVSRENIMGALSDYGGFTPSQIAVMRARIKAWQAKRPTR